jgi:hypothetical protein
MRYNPIHNVHRIRSHTFSTIDDTHLKDPVSPLQGFCITDSVPGPSPACAGSTRAITLRAVGAGAGVVAVLAVQRAYSRFACFPIIKQPH